MRDAASTDHREPLTRFRQCRGEQPRWNCDDAQPHNQHKEGEYFATDSHRSHITVAHGRQSDDGPPEGMEDRRERLELRLILEVIHAANSSSKW